MSESTYNRTSNDTILTTKDLENAIRAYHEKNKKHPFKKIGKVLSHPGVVGPALYIGTLVASIVVIHKYDAKSYVLDVIEE